jgi:hypothetical protein
MESNLVAEDPDGVLQGRPTDDRLRRRQEKDVPVEVVLMKKIVMNKHSSLHQ